MKLTIIPFIIAIMALSSMVNAQNLNCLWAQSAEGIKDEEGCSVSTDVSGNVFMTGTFYSPSIAFGSTTLTNAGTGSITTGDVFIVKYSPTGTVLWANCAGGSSSDYASSISTDANGNVFMVGSFSSPSIAFGSTTLSNAGGSAFTYDSYIVKYSPTGTMLWAKSIGGNGEDFGNGVSVDIGGNVFLSGTFQGPTLAFGISTLSNSGGADIFIVKYSPSGTELWAKSAVGIGTSPDRAWGVSTDANGNVFMTGFFKSPSIIVGTTTLTNSDITGNSGDVFIAKYSPTGTVLWANSAIGSDFDIGRSVSTDISGNVFMTGYFSSPTLVFGSTTLTNAGTAPNVDVFVVKYSPTGAVLWVKSAGAVYDDEATSVSTDASGNVYISGSFSNPTIVFGTTTLTNAGGYDIFIIKYSPVGALLWAESAGGTSSDLCLGVSTDLTGKVFITGKSISPTITLGTYVLAIPGNTSGNGDLFIAKLSDPVVGIYEAQKLNAGITVHPNPFTTQTTISFSEVQTNTSIKIIDILGKEIRSIFSIQSKEVVIEKGTMEAGIYFVQVVDEKNKTLNKKIIVQ